MISKYQVIADRLAQEAATVKYGEVTVTVKIHDGRIVTVTYSTTQNTREVEK